MGSDTVMKSGDKETKKAIIYQIGRLDSNALDKIKFTVNNNSFETILSSFAIRGYLHKKDYRAEIVLFYPISLPYNSALVKNENFLSKCPDDFQKHFINAFNNPEEYLSNPKEFFDSHPHSKESGNFKVIHSLGVYTTSNTEVSFDCYYSDIVLTMLIEMIKRYLLKEDVTEKIIFDISSGHNIYVSALLEAARYFGVWLKLYNWKVNSTEIQIAFSDPVIAFQKQREYKIYFEKLDVRAFFSCPVSYTDIENFKLSKEIYEENRNMKQQLQSVLENLVIIFSAIKNNAPLGIYQFGYHDEDKIFNVLKDFLDNKEKILLKEYIKSPKLNKGNYIKVLLSCGLYLGLLKILKENKVRKISKEGIEIEVIRKSFRNIYKTFDLALNDVILGNEIDKIKQDFIVDKIWKTLISSKGGESTPQKRNFFAHAGFEGNVTECKKMNGRIFLRYNDKYLETIKKWLKESV